MSFSLDDLVKNIPDNGFKYSSEKFSGEQFKLVKQTEVYDYEYM